MKKESDCFGINIIEYCREHEKYIEDRLSAGEDPEILLVWHERKLEWLQHERLIHLLVTMLTTIVFIFTVVLAVCMEGNMAALFLAVILFALLAAYLAHYFRLENRVQHWYRIAEQLHDRLL